MEKHVWLQLVSVILCVTGNVQQAESRVPCFWFPHVRCCSRNSLSPASRKKLIPQKFSACLVQFLHFLKIQDQPKLLESSHPGKGNHWHTHHGCFVCQVVFRFVLLFMQDFHNPCVTLQIGACCCIQAWHLLAGINNVSHQKRTHMDHVPTSVWSFPSWHSSSHCLALCCPHITPNLQTLTRESPCSCLSRWHTSLIIFLCSCVRIIALVLAVSYKPQQYVAHVMSSYGCWF